MTRRFGATSVAVISLFCSLAGTSPILAKALPARAVVNHVQAAIPYADAVILIRSSLMALHQAGETGDYAVLSALGSEAFRAQNPPERLSQDFAGIRSYNIAVIEVTEPRFTEVPHIDARGQMHMAGFFDHGGYRIGFQLVFTPEGGRWRLLGLGAGVNRIAAAPAKK